MKDNVVLDEALSPDLDKKDLQARKKLIYEIEL
jgi:hypothetical protein